MKIVIALMFVATFFAAPLAYAEAGSSGKLLSYVEFGSAPENRGMSQRVIDKRYSEYRSGRFAVATLDTAHIR